MDSNDEAVTLEPLEVDRLQPGDRFSIATDGVHFPVVVKDAWVPSGDTNVVRVHIELPRYWNGGRIPVRLSVFRKEDDEHQ